MSGDYMNFLRLALMLIQVVKPYGDDVTYYSNYVESGHYSTYDGSLAFDNLVNYWRASAADDCDDTCYIGQDFTDPEHVTVVAIQQYGSSVDAHYVDVLYSDDCSSYTTIDRYELPISTNTQFMYLDENGSHRCWIIREVDSWGTSGWIVREIEMYDFQITTVPPIVGTLESGESYAIERTATFGEMSIFLILAILCVIIIVAIYAGLVYAKRNSRDY